MSFPSSKVKPSTICVLCYPPNPHCSKGAKYSRKGTLSHNSRVTALPVQVRSAHTSMSQTAGSLCANAFPSLFLCKSAWSQARSGSCASNITV